MIRVIITMIITDHVMIMMIMMIMRIRTHHLAMMTRDHGVIVMMTRITTRMMPVPLAVTRSVMVVYY